MDGSGSAWTATTTSKFFLTTDGTASGAILQRQRFAPQYSMLDTPVSIGPVIGTWSTVDLYLSADTGGAAIIRILVDGVEALPPTTCSNCPLPSAATFIIGVYDCNNVNEARYDNVKVDAQ